MSATTTDNPIALNLRQTLGDYEIYITGDGNDNSDEILSPKISPVNPVAENPSSWPQDYHRVPDYRPINRQLAGPGRPNGANVAERLFITVMFAGVALNAGAAQFWRRSGGRIFARLFRYAVGGEW